MSITFRSTELYGGAIQADIPQNFLDVKYDLIGPPSHHVSFSPNSKSSSNIREVPDTQEVFLDKDGFTSVIFDILERVDHCRDDYDAFTYHLEDMTDSEERLCISAVQHIPMSKLP